MSLTRKLCLTMGRVIPTVSHSWKASSPMAGVGTCPVMITIGIESMYAVAMPVTAFGHPGPDVTSATPTSPVAPCITVSSMHGGLLVTHQHMPNLVLLEERVVDVEDGAARIAPEELDAFGLQASNQDFRSVWIGGGYGRVSGAALRFSSAVGVSISNLSEFL